MSTSVDSVVNESGFTFICSQQCICMFVSVTNQTQMKDIPLFKRSHM